MMFRKKYTLIWPYGKPIHTWEIECADGGLHVHITEGEPDWYGGIEVHYRTAPDYMKHSAPSHHDCPVLGGICWHDGSSLQAREHWIPMWQGCGGDHDFMFRMIDAELRERFCLGTEDDD
jgi:hypothetical protein